MSISTEVWQEKHRPESLNEIIGHDAVISRMKKYVNDDSVPHLLLSGPPGTGKTTAVTCFAREVFGDNWRSNFHELNASDQRGIDDVRDTIKPIAQASPASGATYKIIFLDEADNLSRDAQPALRRIIEKYSDITRFFLSCNHQNQIIGAIQSRCTPFRFSRLTDDEIRQLLRRIADAEGLSIEVDDIDAIDMIVRGCRGDARSAVKFLQNSAVDGEVTIAQVESVIGHVEYDDLDGIVTFAMSGQQDEAVDGVIDLLKDGADPEMLTDLLTKVVRNRNDLPEPGRHMAMSKIAETDWRLMNGANPHVHLQSLMYDLFVARHITYGDKYEPGTKYAKES